MPNANPFRDANRIYKLPFAVPIKPVTSQGLGVPLLFQTGSWVLLPCSGACRSSGRGCSSPARSWPQAALPAQETRSSPCPEPAGKWTGTNWQGSPSSSGGGSRGGPRSPARGGCSCLPAPPPGCARRLTAGSSVTMAHGTILGVSWGVGMCPEPPCSLWLLSNLPVLGNMPGCWGFLRVPLGSLIPFSLFLTQGSGSHVQSLEQAILEISSNLDDSVVL